MVFTGRSCLIIFANAMITSAHTACALILNFDCDSAGAEGVARK